MNTYMKKIGNLFLQGLIAVLPIVATLSVLYWLGSYTESVLGGLLKLVVPESWYWPGMGLIAGVLVTCGIGLLVNMYVFQQLNKIAEGVLFRIPLVKTLYNGVRDIANFLSTSRRKQDMRTVVLVRVNDDIRLVGFITSNNVPYEAQEESVAVYMPFSYQIGGYTVYIPKSRLEPLDMSIEDAMRMVLTADMGNRE